MASSYPGALDSFTANADGVDDVLAADMNAVQDGVAAIQAELGTDPAGASATVAARLDALDTTVSGKLSTAAASSTYASIAEPIGAAAQTTANAARVTAAAAAAGVNLFVAATYR